MNAPRPRHRLDVDPREDPVILAHAAREWAGFTVWSAGVRFDDSDRRILHDLLHALADFVETPTSPAPGPPTRG